MTDRRAPVLPGPLLFAAGLLLSAAAGAAEDRFADVVVTHEEVRENLYMLQGAGGNIGLLVTDEGVLMVDDQYAPLAERIEAKIDELAGARPRFVLNTHFHGDHTGGNPFFGREGTILAHENVRSRLVAGGMEAAGLPVITYADRVRVHLGGETVDLLHAPNGHTDGDSFVFFREANVVHLGDEFFFGRFPYVDLQSGGSVAGLTANIADALAQVDADTRIIPGHGPLATAADLAAYLEMLRATHDLVADAVASGATDEEIHARGLGTRWASWGEGFVSTERWIDTLLAELRMGAGGR